ncbi:MAG: AlpA family phage regulatory protein [Gallionella sp.]|jgi:prophage regulatory protein
MTQMDQEDVLFSEDIILWDEVVRLAVNLFIPFRHRAKGIECITGGLTKFPSPAEWLPIKLNENDWRFIKEHLHELPSLEFPIPLDISKDFVDKFIMLKDSPSFVPSFLTSMSLNHDQELRDIQFTEYKEELQRLVSERDVLLVNYSRIKCVNLTHGVYFTKREAIQYLERKGLLDRAFATGCSWGDQIREPEVGEISKSAENPYDALPKELYVIGIGEYRKILTLRKYEVIASQLAQLHLKQVEQLQVVEKNSDERNVPVSEPVPVTESASGEFENKPTIVENVVPIVQVSVASSVGKIIKSSSSELPAVSENDEVQAINKNPIAEREMISVSENETIAKRLIGIKDVMDRLGVSRATIYNYMSKTSPSYNPNFPQPLKLNSENKWDETEFNNFVDALKKK